MRRIGGDLTKGQAEKFAEYLYTQGIATNVEAASDGDSPMFDVWVRDEDRLTVAREALRDFRENPGADKFDVKELAEQMRRERLNELRERAKLHKPFQAKGSPAGFGGFSKPARFTVGVIAACVVLSIVTSFGNMRGGPRAIKSVDELPTSMRIFNALTLVPGSTKDREAGPMKYVLEGQVWRLITPIFLHGSPTHLLFNCLIIYFTGRTLEVLFGPLFFCSLFLLGGVVGNLAQAYGPEFLGASPHVIGASGGALALFVFLWLRPMIEPSVPFRVPPLNVAFVLGFVVLSMIPGSPIGAGIANLAHLGGIATGAVAALGMLDFVRR